VKLSPVNETPSVAHCVYVRSFTVRSNRRCPQFLHRHIITSILHYLVKY